MSTALPRRQAAPGRGANVRACAAASLAAALAACASTPEPVLYPNAHLQSVGSSVARRDIAECRQLALGSGVDRHKDGQVGRRAASGAAIGGATGGAYGVFRGDAVERGLGGAAAGAAGGTVRGMLEADETSPVYQKFVNRCLKERGYEVIGWQ